jgi:hypothetical protein
MLTLPAIRNSIHLQVHWPEWIPSIFPALFIFYRKNMPRPGRQVRDGNKGGGVQAAAAPLLPNGTKSFGRRPARRGNRYCIYTAVVMGPEDFSTVARSFTRKGYGTLTGVSCATPEEAALARDSDHTVIFMYKSFSELYNLRGLNDHLWRVMCDEMEKQFPCTATGQLRLF